MKGFNNVWAVIARRKGMAFALTEGGVGMEEEERLNGEVVWKVVCRCGAMSICDN